MYIFLKWVNLKKKYWLLSQVVCRYGKNCKGRIKRLKLWWTSLEQWKEHGLWNQARVWIQFLHLLAVWPRYWSSLRLFPPHYFLMEIINQTSCEGEEVAVWRDRVGGDAWVCVGGWGGVRIMAYFYHCCPYILPPYCYPWVLTQFVNRGPMQPTFPDAWPGSGDRTQQDQLPALQELPAECGN